MLPTWPETIDFGQEKASPNNGWKTDLRQGEIEEGFWLPLRTKQKGGSDGPLRPRVHARPADYSPEDSCDAGLCGEAGLDHRDAIQRDWLGRCTAGEG